MILAEVENPLLPAGELGPVPEKVILMQGEGLPNHHHGDLGKTFQWWALTSLKCKGTMALHVAVLDNMPDLVSLRHIISCIKM